MKIQVLRENAGLTRLEVASRLGLDKSTVSHWELGTAIPRADKLPLLADMFGCSIDELYGRDPPGRSRQTAEGQESA